MIWDFLHTKKKKKKNKTSTVLCAIKIQSKDFICGMISITLVESSSSSLPISGGKKLQFVNRKNTQRLSHEF